MNDNDELLPDPIDAFGDRPIDSLRTAIDRTLAEAANEGRTLSREEALLEAIFGKEKVAEYVAEEPNPPGQAVYHPNSYEINKKGEQIAGQAAEKASYQKPEDQPASKPTRGTTYGGGSLHPLQRKGPE